jgi:predicted enzyme related to lactoylglutathione lyase
VPASSNVIGIRLRVTVGDMERTARFYEEQLGLPGQRGSFSRNHTVSAMMGLPDSDYRLTTIPLPGSPLLLELLELKGLAPASTRSRVQDPGSFRLQLNVRDIDATLAALRSAGSTVISSGGVPVSMTFNTRPWRLAIAPDPNNLFLVVQQGPPAVGPGPPPVPAPAERRP